ncbi:MAG: hypothetical protein K6E10_10805 [Eubacterium sp.]|nr:hypothetical protein [Eubacterium sp.]
MKKFLYTAILISAGLSVFFGEDLGLISKFPGDHFRDVSRVYAEDLDGDGYDDETGTALDGVQEGDSEYFDYTGELDPITGKPLYVTEDETTGIVKINDNYSYDFDNMLYVFPVSGGSFGCSVADGMITTGAVQLAKAGEYNLSVYKDGEKVGDSPAKVSDAGTYTVITWDNTNEKQLMSFTIIPKTTGKINQYLMPDGFVVESVKRDGVETDRVFGLVDMSKDGYYDISYSCTTTGLDYNLQVYIDHIPPQVIFEGVDSDNKAKGPVTIKGFEDGDTISIKLDDRNIRLDSDHTLKDSGYYKVSVYDQAGNVTQRSFTIMLYLNVKTTVLLISFLAIIIGVIVALYITRKRLRVR